MNATTDTKKIYKTGILRGFRNRGPSAWLLASVIIVFYILLYWDNKIDRTFIYEPALSSLNKQYQEQVSKLKDKFSFKAVLTSISSQLNWLSQILRNKDADKWFLYGFLYTFFVLSMGIYFLRKWKHIKYQKIRTLSVMFFQTIFAFLLPSILVYFNTKEFYFSYFWPLKPEYFYPKTLASLPAVMAVWTVFMSFIAVPVLTYFFGKRWYCSWVCGCGALANTAGDPFRHLSNKSELSWKIERLLIYPILVIIIIVTALLFINEIRSVNDAFSEFVFSLKKIYGFFIVAGFAGVIGTGFYPIGGTRIWCRFGCPQAAILGILQVKFSQFKITTNGNQCMSCGNCSVYCEMGIDVRSYAMTGRDIVRASCVGCGLCSSVCPRGVLKLENTRHGAEKFI
jgi:Pyruvate/2-oxoacid:ferredoxin oxidoreductase delta subunit